MFGWLTIGGRKFRRFAELSVLRDSYLVGALSESGLATIEYPIGASPEEIAHLAWAALQLSGAIPKILGGALTPHGMKDREWDVEVAEETAAFIEPLTKPKDHMAIAGAAHDCMAFFLRTERVLLIGLQTSSSRPAAPVVPQRLHPWGPAIPGTT